MIFAFDMVQNARKIYENIFRIENRYSAFSKYAENTHICVEDVEKINYICEI